MYAVAIESCDHNKVFTISKPFDSFSFTAGGCVSFFYDRNSCLQLQREGLKKLLFEIKPQLPCQENANGAEMDRIFYRLVKIWIVPSWF